MTRPVRANPFRNDAAVEPYQQRPKSKIIRYPSEPVDRCHIRDLRHLQEKFNIAFPPIRSEDQDVLIVNWAEIERQFLDLCAPWDQQSGYHLIQSIRSDAPYESAEKTLRNLFVINNIRSNLDTPEPEWGTGENLPMP